MLFPGSEIFEVFGITKNIYFFWSPEKSQLFVSEFVNGEIYQYYPLGEHVVRAIGICGERPTFKYTRIEVAGVLDRLAAGETLEVLVTGYRGRVSREAILEALRVVMAGFLDTLPELEPA